MITPQTFEEVKQVLAMLNRNATEGDVRGRHLTTVLCYLATIKREEYEKALAKLTLLLGVARRQVKENYLDGLEAWGFVKIAIEKNERYIEWQGVPPTNFVTPVLPVNGNGQNTTTTTTN